MCLLGCTLRSAAKLKPHLTALHELLRLPYAAPTTLIFDVDDTLYDVACGFTAYRNGASVWEMMTTQLGFSTAEEAKALRDEYFAKYHATAKALQMAEADGRLPAGAHFEPAMLAEWWSTKLDFDAYLSPDELLINALATSPLKLVAFTNAPRKYALCVLEALGVRRFFMDEHIFAVDDVLPECKPEPAAFLKVLSALGVQARECVMIEDSMKNIRAAKALGMRTVLVAGKPGVGNAAAASEATKAGDLPQADDPAVDTVLFTCGELKQALPGLWANPPVFG